MLDENIVLARRFIKAKNAEKWFVLMEAVKRVDVVFVSNSISAIIVK
jgi:hypothetical protein